MVDAPDTVDAPEMTDTPDSVEAPVVEAPVVEAPVIEAPVIEAPVIEVPIIEAPVIEVPVIEVDIASITEIVADAASVTADVATVVTEVVQEQETTDQADVITDEPVIDEPVIDEPVIDEPVIDEPVIDEPVIDEPVIDEPVIDEPVIDEPVIDEPVIDEPVIDEPVDEEPVIDEPVDEEPVIDEPTSGGGGGTTTPSIVTTDLLPSTSTIIPSGATVADPIDVNDYLNYGYWTSTDTTNPAGVYINGVITPSEIINDLLNVTKPTLNYTGNIAARVMDTSGNCVQSSGSIGLNVDFANKNLTGTIDVTEGTWKAKIDSGTITRYGISSPSISSNTGSSVTDITGNLKGDFYGTSAQSVGGVFDLSSPTSGSVEGAFGATIQTPN